MTSNDNESPNDDDLAQLCLQVQATLAPELNLDSLKQASERIAKDTDGVRGIGFSEGDDNGKYLNIIFAVENPAIAWPQLRRQLLESAVFGPSLQKCAMVVCTGEDGWDDYLLLHHFDSTATLDNQSEA